MRYDRNLWYQVSQLAKLVPIPPAARHAKPHAMPHPCHAIVTPRRTHVKRASPKNNASPVSRGGWGVGRLSVPSKEVPPPPFFFDSPASIIPYHDDAPGQRHKKAFLSAPGDVGR